jgi:hypothetical protein
LKAGSERGGVDGAAVARILVNKQHGLIGEEGASETVEMREVAAENER